MKNIIVAILTISALSLSGCSTWDKLDQKERGAVIGGGGGAVIGGASGSTTGAVVGGALGALGGGLVGNEMDKNDDRDYDHRDRRY